MNRFCEKMDIPNVTEMYLAITTGLSFKAVAELILCSVEYVNREKPHTTDEAMDWIDDMGGIDKAVEIINKAMIVEEKEGAKKKEVETY